MSKLKIVQSMHLLHIASMITYEAVIDAQSNQAFKNLLAGENVPAASLSEDSVILVFPVQPKIGDTVLSYFEGDAITGVVVGVEGPQFSIEFPSYGWIVGLTRNQFHVVAPFVDDSWKELTLYTKVVVTKGDTHGAAVGVTAYVYSPQAYKDIFGRQWVAAGSSFRAFDDTLIDFDFADEPNQVAAITAAMNDTSPRIPLAEAAEAIREVPLTDVEQDAISDVSDDLASEDELAAILHVDLESYGDFKALIFNEAGDEISLDDIPAEHRTMIEGAIADLKAHVGVDIDVEDDATDAFDALGVLFKDIMDGVVDHRKNQLHGSAAKEMAENSEYLDDALDEINDHIDGAISTVSLAMNLLGRTANLVHASDPKLSAALIEVNSLLANTRSEVLEISKARHDIISERQVSAAAMSHLSANLAALN